MRRYRHFQVYLYHRHGNDDCDHVMQQVYSCPAVDQVQHHVHDLYGCLPSSWFNLKIGQSKCMLLLLLYIHCNTKGFTDSCMVNLVHYIIQYYNHCGF